MLTKPSQLRKVYLDHAATTPTDPRVVTAMQPYFTEIFGNPSSLYSAGQTVHKAIQGSRQQIANILGTVADSIIFTSGGSEADNLAIYGVARANATNDKHIITTKIEHHAVLHPLEDLAAEGFDITYVPVDSTGRVDPFDIIKAIRPDTILISIMYANNEIGSIEPIAEIGKGILKHRREHKTPYPYFHTDACQATGYLDLNVERLHVDLMTINGSKMYGPKGIGALYVRRGVKLKPLIVGGSQESRLRAGTENTPGIVGLATALTLAQSEKEVETKRVRDLTTYFWQELQKQIPNITLHGPTIGKNRLANNLNIAFRGLEAEALLLYLDSCGIMCSAGSACTARSTSVSHVLHAMGVADSESEATLRFSLGHSTTEEDIDYVLEHLPKMVIMLRETASLQ